MTAKPSPQRLLTYWVALDDDDDRDSRLRQMAACLKTPPEREPSHSASVLDRPSRYLTTPSVYEKRTPVVALAWLLAGERQRVRECANRDDVVGWSLREIARWATFFNRPDYARRI